MNLEELKEAKQLNNKIAAYILSTKDWGMDKDIETFVYGMSFLTPQSYGARIQNRIIKDLGFQKVKAKEDCGDAKDTQGAMWEIKVSLLTGTNCALNMVQIRPWQELSGYYCLAFDVRDNNFAYHAFKLTKEQMGQELKLIRHGSAHGTKTANLDNSNIEIRLAIDILPSEEIFQRWNAKYGYRVEAWDKQIAANAEKKAQALLSAACSLPSLVISQPS